MVGSRKLVRAVAELPACSGLHRAPRCFPRNFVFGTLATLFYRTAALRQKRSLSRSRMPMPRREAWLRQLACLQEKRVKFDRCIDHGMTHSLYIHDPNGYGMELVYELP